MTQLEAHVAANELPHFRTYSHWRRPRSAGLGTLSGPATVLLFIGAPIFIVVLFVTDIWGALTVALLLAALLYGMSVTDKHGRSILTRMSGRIMWASSKRRKTNLYRSGPLGSVPYGRNRLPGIGALTEVTEWQDSWGRPFGLIHIPFKSHFTIVLSGEPDGAALVDQSQIDVWVAHWGHFMATLGNEAGIVAASVTIESAPDHGTRLRTEVENNLDPDAPPLSRAVLQDIVESYPRGSANVRAFIAITFSGQTREGGHRRPVEEVARDLASRIGLIGQQLATTGAGSIRPIGAQELCEIVRVAYDPAVASVIASQRAGGGVPPMDWADVGPVGAEASWDYYRHDSGVSRTWQMTQAPRGEVYSNVLQRLLEPSPFIARKRVTLAYRPIDPASAAVLVEEDRKTSNIRMTSTEIPSLRIQVERQAAEATAREEARGAGLVNFGMYVTATVRELSELPDASAAIDNLAASARLFLRPVTGSQDSAFAAALPIGLVLPEYLAVPTAAKTRVSR